MAIVPIATRANIWEFHFCGSPYVTTNTILKNLMITGYNVKSWFTPLHPQVEIIVLGRFLAQVGSGFTLLYTSIFFVNQLGFSSTSVGLALGSASISGIIGRIMAGSFCDSEFWGRRRTMLLAAGIGAIASLILAATTNFSTLVAANLLMGLALGLYGPANDAAISDLTAAEQYRETYALIKFIDNIGLEIGIILSGALIGITGAYRTLFVINASAYVFLFVLVYTSVVETYKPQLTTAISLKDSWRKALSDRRLLVFVVVNILFTTYCSQLTSILPLYFKNVCLTNSGQGFSETTISTLFSWHIALAIVLQLPSAHVLKRYSQAHALMFSAVMWALGFGVIWVMSVTSVGQMGWAILGLEILAIATICFIPAATSLVKDLAPPSQRGVYFSINSLCWAVGYFIGPLLGGWILDQPNQVADSFWIGLACSVIITIAILQHLHQMLQKV